MPAERLKAFKLRDFDPITALCAGGAVVAGAELKTYRYDSCYRLHYLRIGRQRSMTMDRQPSLVIVCVGHPPRSGWRDVFLW